MKNCDLHLDANIVDGELVLSYRDDNKASNDQDDDPKKCRINPNGRLEVEHNREHKEAKCHIGFTESGYRLHVFSVGDDGKVEPWSDGYRHFDLEREGNEAENYFFLVAVGEPEASPRVLFLDPVIVYRPKPPPDDDVVLEISDND